MQGGELANPSNPTLTLRETLQRQQDSGTHGCLPKELFTSCTSTSASNNGSSGVRRNLWKTGITDIRDILGGSTRASAVAPTTTTTWYVDQSGSTGHQGQDQDAEAFFQVRRKKIKNMFFLQLFKFIISRSQSQNDAKSDPSSEVSKTFVDEHFWVTFVVFSYKWIQIKPTN